MINFTNISIRKLFPSLALMAGAYLLFASTFKSPWLIDDYPVILNNPAILSLTSFLEHSHFLRPLRELSLMLDYKLFGFNSTGYHIQQIFWHGLNAVLMYYFVVRIGLSNCTAWTAALLFLVHPIHVEVVANISHRKDSLALAFALWSLLAYHQSFSEDSRRLFWRLVSAFCMLLGFLAKGNIIVMPLILWLYETAFVPHEKRLLARYNRFAPLFAMLGAAAMGAWFYHIWNQWDFRQVILGAMIKMENYSQFSQHDYFLLVLKSFSFMVLRLFWPVNLSMEYTFPVPNGWFDPWVIATIILLLIIFMSLVAWQRKSKPLFFALGWLLIFWIPTSNLFWHFTYFAADRYIYTPSFGFCLILAVSFDTVTKKWPHISRLLTAVGIIVIAILATLTWRQNLIWNDGERLYQHILEVSPGTKMGIMGLSNRYIMKGKPEKSLALLESYLQADSLYVDADIYNQAGLVYHAMGNYSTAISYYRKALKKEKDNVEFHNNLGSVLDDAGRFTEAEEVSRKSTVLAPKNDMAHYNLGVSLYNQDRHKEARHAFAKAAQLNPGNADALFNLAVVLNDLGEHQSVRETIAKLRAIDPKRADNLDKHLSSN